MTEKDQNGFRDDFRHELNSRWTTEQLRELIESVNKERDRRYSDKFEAMAKEMAAGFAALREAMAAGFAAAKEAVAAALAAAKEAVVSAFESAKEAITKSEIATEKRFESVNEFRSTLKDQQASLMPRSEADKTTQQHRDLIAAVEKRVGDLERGESRGAGAENAALLARQNSNRITALMIAVFLSLLGTLGQWAFMLFGKH